MKHNRIPKIGLVGLATTRQIFVAEDGTRTRFGGGCFSNWLRSGGVPFTPMFLNHNERFALSVTCVSARMIRDGLEIQTRMKVEGHRERDTLLALRLGRFGGLSLGYVTLDCHTETDDGGILRVIDDADVDEISIVDWPRMTKAGIDFQNSAHGSTREWREPANADDARRLESFLTRIGYRDEPPSKWMRRTWLKPNTKPKAESIATESKRYEPNPAIQMPSYPSRETVYFSLTK